MRLKPNFVKLYLFLSGFSFLLILLILILLVPFYSSKTSISEDIFAIPVPDFLANICFFLGHLSRLCSIIAVITIVLNNVFEYIFKGEHLILNWKYFATRWFLAFTLGIMAFLIYLSTTTLLAGAYVSGSPDSIFIQIPSFKSF